MEPVPAYLNSNRSDYSSTVPSAPPLSSHQNMDQSKTHLPPTNYSTPTPHAVSLPITNASTPSPVPLVSPSTQQKYERKEEDVNITAPYIAGFFVGYITWILGFFIFCYGGDGKRTKALRRGVWVGCLAITVWVVVLAVIAIIIALSTRESYSYSKFFKVE